MKKYRKKPVVVEAVRFFANPKSVNELVEFLGDEILKTTIKGNDLIIHTLEGDMKAEHGDWIIKEPFGTDDRKFYPCKNEIFLKTYELAE